jgi:hypothetical protein
MQVDSEHRQAMHAGATMRVYVVTGADRRPARRWQAAAGADRVDSPEPFIDATSAMRACERYLETHA